MTREAGGGPGSPVPRSADVARLAGVSRKTVSRVLNDEPYVSDEARRRVLAAAEELGYRLNHAARALASGRTRSIGVVALGTAGYGTASLLVHLEQAVRDAGYALRVVYTPDGDPEGIAGALKSLLEQGVDGTALGVAAQDHVTHLELGDGVLDGRLLAVGGGPGGRTVAAQQPDPGRDLADRRHEFDHGLDGQLQRRCRWYLQHRR